jgi:hypothetical protein
VTSIGPVLLIVIAIAGLAFGQYAAQNALTAQLSGLMGQQTAEFLQTAVASAASKSSDRGDDDWNYHFNSDGLGRLRRNANCVKCDLEGYAQGHHSLVANSRTRCQPRISRSIGISSHGVAHREHCVDGVRRDGDDCARAGRRLDVSARTPSPMFIAR